MLRVAVVPAVRVGAVARAAALDAGAEASASTEENPPAVVAAAAVRGVAGERTTLSPLAGKRLWISAMRAWTAAAQRTKGLERLRERHVERLQAAADAAETRMVDDLVTGRHGGDRPTGEEGTWTD